MFKVAVTDSDQALCCDSCDKWCHYNCITPQTLSFERLEKKAFFYCSDECKTKLSPALIKQFEIIKQTINELSKNIEKTNTSVGLCKKEVEIVKLDVLNLKKADDSIYQELNTVKSELNQIKQENLKINAICFGVVHQEKEKTLEVLSNILRDNNIPTTGLISCRRIFNKNSNKFNVQLPIILTFSSDKERNLLLQNTRKTKIFSTVASSSLNADSTSSTARVPIIFKVLLTRQNKVLYDATIKSLSKKVKHIWTTNGKIIVRVAEKDKKLWYIKTETDIQYLIDSLVNLEN